MDNLFDLAPLLALPSVVKIIDAYRQLVTEQNYRKLAFTVGAWVLGTLLVYLVDNSSSSPFPNPLLPADAILYGIGLGSSASIVHDVTSNRKTEGHEVVMPSIVVTSGEVKVGDEPAVE